ncbi:hypothetical protein, partial [Rhodoblastus acidophilus]|uniref:hypothetical protein n=1 Tax=Rhodoblastus acidophilus TaxID=1074 RepID=UPI001FDA1624
MGNADVGLRQDFFDQGARAPAGCGEVIEGGARLNALSPNRVAGHFHRRPFGENFSLQISQSYA